MRSRRAPPPRRRSSVQPARRIVRVLTEGRLTEVEYFTEWAAEFRHQLTMDIDPFHGTSLPLVERAVELTAERQRVGQTLLPGVRSLPIIGRGDRLVRQMYISNGGLSGVS